MSHAPPVPSAAPVFAAPNPPALPSRRAWDPWIHLYLCATTASVARFQANVRHIDSLPADAQGDAFALAARGWWRLGDAAAAHEAWGRAEKVGGDEVEVLRPFLFARGARWAAERARMLTEAGLCADAWCDVAALAMDENDRPRARRAIRDAFDACPDHAEAGHWGRVLEVRRPADFLDDWPGGDPSGVAARGGAGGADVAGRRRGLKGVLLDLEHLLPARRNGWCSPERYVRRVVQREYTAAPAGSGLARLAQAGVPEFHLATAQDWIRVSASHPLVSAELEIDHLLALIAEDRPAFDLATHIWAGARTAGDADRATHVARLLCELAVREPTLAPLGLVAADCLLAAARPDPTIRALSAWHGATLAEPDAADHARTVLSDDALEDELAWRLAVGALYRSGAPADGAAEIARARRDPVRGPWARSLAGRDARPEHVRVWIGPRVFPRGLGGGAGVGVA